MGNFPSISDEARMYQLLEAKAKEMVLHMTGCSGEPGELPGLEWYTDGDGKDFHTGQRPTEHVRCLMQVVHILLLMRVHVPRCATVTRTSFSWFDMDDSGPAPLYFWNPDVVSVKREWRAGKVQVSETLYKAALCLRLCCNIGLRSAFFADATQASWPLRVA